MLQRLFDPEVPFAPRRFPFPYGHWILVMMIIGTAASIPGQTMGVSVFTAPLSGATGLDALQLSITYGVGTAISSLLLPFGGRLIDRWGCRRTAVFAALSMGATLLLFANIEALLAASIAGTAATALVVTTVLFAALRFSGQGMLTLSARTMLGRWFDRHRGRAAAISGVVIGFAFSSAPLTLKLLRDGVGWRWAWIVLALGVGGGMAVLAWLFFRDNPEECGLRVDGGPAAADDSRRQPAAASDRNRAEALRTAAFWAVALLLGCHATVFTGIAFHIEPIGAESGLDSTQAVAVFLPMAVVGTVSSFLAGIACDRYPIRRILVVMALLQAGGFAAMAFYGHPVGYWLTVVVLGAAGGLFGPVSTVAPPALFGRKHLGAIGGAIMTAMVLGSALGPALLAGFARFASFRTGLLASAALPLMVLAVVARARPPPLRADDAAEGA
ncbi:MAG: MFS transporter [Planctomycetota bacterium]